MTNISETRHARSSWWHVVEYNLLGTKSFWKSALITGVSSPLMYVLALGVGLGAVVNRNSTTLGVPYLVFVAPAFLTAAALQIGAAEAAYPVMAGFKWYRTFHGMTATPMQPGQIADGMIAWIAIRLFVNAAAYLAIMACFGAAQRWQVVFAVAVATLTGTAFAAPVVAIAASTSDEGQLFNLLFRFVVTPLFLFSGTFYPISQLPRWGQWLAYFSPLWHGTEVARDAGIGGLSTWSVLGHLAYLALWLVVGVGLARWRFRVRLTR